MPLNHQKGINLLAIWIGSNFGILKDRLFSFDPEFIIEVEGTDRKIVRLCRNPDFLPDFFGEKVSYVTAIVGKNGVGKSTSLRFLKELFLKERSDLDNREEDIIVFREGTDIQVMVNRSQQKHIQVINDTDLNFNMVYYIDYPKVLDRIKNFNTLFYSNSLETENWEKETVNYYNLSTGYLKENFGKVNEHVRNKRIRSLGGSKRFRYTEFKRQIDFLNTLDRHDPKIDIPFKRIREIKMELKVLIAKDYKKQFEQYIQDLDDAREDRPRNPQIIDETSEQILELSKELPAKFQARRDENPSSRDIFENVFYENLIFYVVRLIFSEQLLKIYVKDHGLLNEFIRLIDRRTDDFRYNNYHRFADLIQDLEHLLSDIKKRENNDNSNKPISHLSDLLKQLNEFEKFMQKGISTAVPERHSLLLDTQSSFFTSLFESYYTTELDLQFMTFRWQQLSAGEESLVACFSRLYQVLKEGRNDNVLILIDEGDLYFHPEWQRDYVYFLLEFLNSELLVPVNIQVILTTHSPFIVSDLPRENIILMKAHEVESISDLPTFGGNLHTLFSENFFLGESGSSLFARKKIISEIIEPLENPRSQPNPKRLALLISKVGEPVLKAMLKKSFDKRYGENY